MSGIAKYLAFWSAHVALLWAVGALLFWAQTFALLALWLILAVLAAAPLSGWARRRWLYVRPPRPRERYMEIL